jgi:hypothetical protein
MPPRLLLTIATSSVAVLLSLAHAGDAAAYQHVQNGGFEDGTVGWAAAAGTSLASTAIDAAPEGDRYAAVSMMDRRFGVTQLLDGALAAGAYRVAFSARTASNDAELTLTVRSIDDPSLHFDVSSTAYDDGWRTVSHEFWIGQATRMQLLISGTGNGTATVYLDDVRIEGAPPTTLTPTPTPTIAPPAPPLTGTEPAGSGTPQGTPTAPARSDEIAEYLRNAGFEEVAGDGSPFAWHKFGGEFSIATAARSGSTAARLTSGTDSTKWIYQAVTVRGGETYAFDAWIENAGNGSAFLRVSWYGSGDASGEHIGNADSTERLDEPRSGYRYLTTGPITAPPEASSARLRIMIAPPSAAHAEILVDDASWSTAEPLPPTPLADEDVAVAAGEDAALQRGDAPETTTRRRTSTSTSAFDPDEWTGSASGALVINEVLYDSAVADDSGGEWVEIYNPGDEVVHLDGWTLRDGSSSDVLPGISVAPRGLAIIAASEETVADYRGPLAVVGRIGNGLGNDGDALHLVDPTGRIVDAISWGDDASVLDPSIADAPEGHSVERRPAGADTNNAADFVENARPSPGYAGADSDQPSRGGTTIDVLGGASAADLDWLPWALVGASGAAFAGILGWRTFSMLRSRATRA